MNYSNELENFKLDSENIKNELSEYCNSIIKRYESALNTFEKSQSNINDIKIQYEKTIEQLNQKHLLIKTDLDNKLIDLQKRNKELLDEMTSLKKVSLLNAMNKQLHEKDLTIDLLQKKIETLKLKIVSESPRIKTPTEIVNIIPVEIPIENIHENENNEDEIIQDDKNNEIITDVSDEQVEDIENNTDTVEDNNNEEVVEDEETVEDEENVEDEETVEDEEEIEYEVKKIGKKYYYISNEEPAGIYTVIKEDNSVGDKVGEYDGDKPLFY